MDGRFDDLLLGMAQKHKGIEDLWYTIMSFYERHTDIFHVKDRLDSPKGFKAGQAEEFFRKQFNHFQARYLERAQPHLLVRRGPQSGRAAPHLTNSAAAISPAVDAGAGASFIASPARQQVVVEASDAEVAEAANASVGRLAPASADLPMGVNASPLEGGDPGQWEGEQKQEDSGRCRWNQSLTEITVEVLVDKCTKQDVNILLAARTISVKCKGDVALEGGLFDKINCEESTWHLEDGKRIVLSLEKSRPMYWERLIDGDCAVAR